MDKDQEQEHRELLEAIDDCTATHMKFLQRLTVEFIKKMKNKYPNDLKAVPIAKEYMTAVRIIAESWAKSYEKLAERVKKLDEKYGSEDMDNDSENTDNKK